MSKNTGENNSGNGNSGDWNSGNWNSGEWNSGNWNSGNGNSGECNSGNWNSGDGNGGDWNSGNGNSGNWNSGNGNSGNWNSGYLNKDEPLVRIFGKETTLKREELLFPNYFHFTHNEWIDEDKMNDKEKEAYPSYVTCGGYLKTREYKQAWKEAYYQATIEDREKTLKLPNFDADIFYEISGIDLRNGEYDKKQKLLDKAQELIDKAEELKLEAENL